MQICIRGLLHEWQKRIANSKFTQFTYGIVNIFSKEICYIHIFVHCRDNTPFRKLRHLAIEPRFRK